MSLTQILLFPIVLGASAGQLFLLLSEGDEPLVQENGFRILVE